MTDDSSTSSSVRLSDPVTVVLAQAAHKLRSARALSEEQGDTPKQRALISTAWDAVQDALDVRGEQ